MGKRLLLIGLAALTLAACGGGGATSETAVHNTTVSKGQALIDLTRALDEGAISSADYERQRAQILKEP
jgi:hypothetical protein